VGGVCAIQVARLTPLSGQNWSFIVSLDAPPSPLPFGVARGN